MKNLNNYIIEKLKLNDNIKTQTEKKVDDPTTWDVGDIVVATWGYSMTIVDFYQIIKATGKSFTLRELEQKIVHGDGQRGESVPIEGKFNEREKPINVRINKYGSVKIDRAYCRLWTGQPVSFDHMD